jgi:class 3 adenylate cyclase/pimeloyl-ACP methyl ester carboxylesterase
VDVPDPKYVKAEDGAYIAYQVVGDGPVDVAWLFDFTGNLDCVWEYVAEYEWYSSLASFGRLILHDRRGTGLSSRDRPVPNLETRAADLRLVLDKVNSDQTVIGAYYEGLSPGLMLAASQPDRIRALVWWHPWPRTTWAPDYPWGEGPEEIRTAREMLVHWGSIEWALDWADTQERANGFRPSQDDIRWMAKATRNTCTPDMAAALTEMWWQTDVRGLLPAVQTPSLLLAEEGESETGAVADHVASLMPNATVERVPRATRPRNSAEAATWYRPYRRAVEQFIGLAPHAFATDTVLATVLFTDIVGSTAHQAVLGDHEWKELVEHHHATVRQALHTWRGVENDTAGDGFYATFDGPARAIHCAHQIRDTVRSLGIEIRAGVHTGECELVDGKCAGISVSIGARIAARARPSQVLVSQTVKDLVAGSGFTFQSIGEHELKGVPEHWRIYDVA